ncbi:MAG: hypothetical protein JO288_13980 [Hyphomicrobiales bacterium]|nr:hypothetical protein [Hyphomicrobiales bacterium]
MRLSEYARGRDNNFTLIRLLAALTVVLYHSGPALGFRADGKSLFEFVGRSFGEMALDMLFGVSGFLVPRASSTAAISNHFLWARALRLHPALWLMLPLTVFLLARALREQPARSRGRSPSVRGTWPRSGRWA